MPEHEHGHGHQAGGRAPALQWPPQTPLTAAAWPGSRGGQSCWSGDHIRADQGGNAVASGQPGQPHTADWLLDDVSNHPNGADNTAEHADQCLIWQVNGAPAGSAGRFAAEWCPAGASSHRSAFRRARVRERRTDGGVMVRRAILDRGDQLTADDEALPPSRPFTARSDQAAAHWRGAGGRWLVWIARAVVWAVLILIGYRGVLAIIQGQESGTTSGSSAAAAGSTQFPTTMAGAYAMEFGDVYLNFSPATAARRSQALAAFLPPGTDPQLGWDGAGTQVLLSEQVAGISVTGSHTAVVTLLARLNNVGLIELGVPIYAAQGGVSISGDPALLPAPAKAELPQGGQQTPDQSAETALQNQLPAFFEAYASGDQTTLARFAAPGAHITGLSGAVTFGAIDSVYAPAGGSSREISVTVTWQLASSSRARNAVAAAPAALQMTYQMSVLRQDGSWDVQSISASTQPLAQGPP
jgi:hypothetical protein